MDENIREKQRWYRVIQAKARKMKSRELERVKVRMGIYKDMKKEVQVRKKARMA